jgi:hypothetical protein
VADAFDAPPGVGPPWIHSSPLKVLYSVGTGAVSIVGGNSSFGSDSGVARRAELKTEECHAAAPQDGVALECEKTSGDEVALECEKTPNHSAVEAVVDIQFTATPSQPLNPTRNRSVEVEVDSTEVAGIPLPGIPLMGSEREVWLQQYNKSVKADDTQSPVHLWDDRVWSLGWHSYL